MTSTSKPWKRIQRKRGERRKTAIKNCYCPKIRDSLTEMPILHPHKAPSLKQSKGQFQFTLPTIARMEELFQRSEKRTRRLMQIMCRWSTRCSAIGRRKFSIAVTKNININLFKLLRRVHSKLRTS